MSVNKAFVGIDWGTSTFRLMSFDEQGALQHVKTAADGLSKLTKPEIVATLKAALVEYPDQSVIMCGMVGSTIGLQQAPYIDCPASLTELVAALVPVDHAQERFRRDMWIVPGMRFDAATLIQAKGHDEQTDRLDVMRGEEVQVLGWLDAKPEHRRDTHQLCLPGTHSKWVCVDQARMINLRTALTGELYAVLKDHSVLVSGEQVWNKTEFTQGVRMAAQPGGLLEKLFSTRARVVAADQRAEYASSYLSGLLLGTELKDCASASEATADIHVIGDTTLAQRYWLAASVLSEVSNDQDALDFNGRIQLWDGDDMVAKGLSSIWKAHVE